MKEMWNDFLGIIAGGASGAMAGALALNQGIPRLGGCIVAAIVAIAVMLAWSAVSD